MIKKNRHRAGRKKRERILRAQQRALLAADLLPEPTRPIHRVEPIRQEPTVPGPTTPIIPLVDLTEEDTILLDDLPTDNVANRYDFYEPIETYSDVEILDQDPPLSPDSRDVNESINTLEPLDPNFEFRQNISYLFMHIDEYARSVLDNRRSE